MQRFLLDGNELGAGCLYLSVRSIEGRKLY